MNCYSMLSSRDHMYLTRLMGSPVSILSLVQPYSFIASIT